MKKKVYFDINYFIILMSANDNPIFDDGILNELETKEINNYLINSQSELISSKVINHGKAILLKMMIHPNSSISNIAYNLKRLSYNRIYRKLKSKLNGSRNIWSRDFVVTESSLGENRALDLYYKLLIRHRKEKEND